MLFRKKKRMIDIRQLQKREVVRIPQNNVEVPQDMEGFVELNKFKENPKPLMDTFGFTKTTNPKEDPTNFSSESGGYNKQEVDTKITDLDNKIYKLEQRIELLERKLDVNPPQDSNQGIIGW